MSAGDSQQVWNFIATSLIEDFVAAVLYV
jgi:hypothetical protein